MSPAFSNFWELQGKKKCQEAVLKSTEVRLKRFRSKTWVHVHFERAFCCFSVCGSQLQGLPCKQRNRSALACSFLSNKTRNTDGGGSANIAEFGVNMQSSVAQQAQHSLPPYSSGGAICSVHAVGLLSERLCRSSFFP